MTSPLSEEQLLRDWMTETVWLPDSDLSGVQARVHRTPQHRDLVPPFDPGGIVRMFSATKLFVASVIVALVGGVLILGLVPGGGQQQAGPAAISPTAEPLEAPSEIITPTEEPTLSEGSVIAPTELATDRVGTARRKKRVHWEDGGITFEADDFTIDAFGRTFKPQTLKWLENRYKGQRVDGIPPEAIIEGHWKDRGTAMRLRLVLRSDGKQWWIRNAMTFGEVQDQKNLLSYPSLKKQTRTRIGDVMDASIDVARPGDDMRLRIDGLRIDAFRPGAIPDWTPAPKNPRLRVEVASKTMLPGQRQRLTAEWCLESDCWPATDVRWSSDDPDTIDFAPTTGAWTEVTALKPGRGVIIGRKGLQGPRHTIWVYPRPGAGNVPQGLAPRKVDIAAPARKTLRIGQHVIVTGWRCPTDKADQFGADGRPGTEDDGCETRDIDGVRSIGDSTLSLIEMVGPSALLRVDGFEGLGGGIAPSPVQLGFRGNRTVPIGDGVREEPTLKIGSSSLYLRDAPWSGPDLGDLDGDGSVDARDVEALSSSLEADGPSIVRGEHGWQAALDLDSDGQIDEVDLQMLEALERSHAGVAVAEPLTQRWPWFEEAPAAMMEAVAGKLTARPRTASAERVHWSDGGVIFEARDFTIKTNGLTFKPRKPQWTTGWHGPRSIKSVPRTATIQSGWRDQGRPMRLWFRLETNGRNWWVKSIYTYDGTKEPEYLSYTGLKKQTLTPVGEAFEGALTAQATGGQRKALMPGANVRIEGMRLEAFDVDAIPSPTPTPVLPELNVTIDNTSPLPGQTARVEARWCLTKGNCWPAENVRWSTQSPRIVQVEPTTGSWTLLTARKAGSGSVEAHAPSHGYAIGFDVRPRPGRIDDYEQYDQRGFYLGTPREQVLKVGQYAVVTGWRCPTKGLNRLGDDREPGTDDDRCSTGELANVWLNSGTGLAHVGTAGPSAVIVADAYALDQDDVMASWVGLGFETDAGGRATAAPYVYIRDAEWRGALLGDLDEDGLVDGADVAVVTAALDQYGPAIATRAEGWREPLDLNGDSVIDRIDVDVLGLLVGAHSGEITPVLPTPRPPLLPDPIPQPSESPEPSSGEDPSEAPPT